MTANIRKTVNLLITKKPSRAPPDVPYDVQIVNFNHYFVQLIKTKYSPSYILEMGITTGCSRLILLCSLMDLSSCSVFFLNLGNVIAHRKTQTHDILIEYRQERE